MLARLRVARVQHHLRCFFITNRCQLEGLPSVLISFRAHGTMSIVYVSVRCMHGAPVSWEVTP